MSNFTGLGLAAFARKALAENWGYALGEFGRVLDSAGLSYMCGRSGEVGAYNSAHSDYLKKFIGNRVTDCYGLVKAYLWTDAATGAVRYDAAQDRNQEMAYSAAREKSTLATLPELPGLVLWMRGHAGIYIGGGEFIECAGAPIGMRKGLIKAGVIMSGSKFTHWFKDSFIDYSAPENTAEPSDWAKTAWAWGMAQGVTDGTNPRGAITREQTVQMLYNAIGKRG